jgi:hypothetical protein
MAVVVALIADLDDPHTGLIRRPNQHGAACERDHWKLKLGETYSED